MGNDIIDMSMHFNTARGQIRLGASPSIRNGTLPRHGGPHSKPHVRMRGDPECRTEFEARRRHRAPPPAHNKDHSYHRNTDWDDDDRQKLIATLSGFISPDRAKHQGTWRPGSIQSRHAAAERWHAEQSSLAEFDMTHAELLEQTERLSSYASPGLLPEELMEDQMDKLRQELDFERSARSDAEDRLRESSLDAQLADDAATRAKRASHAWEQVDGPSRASREDVLRYQQSWAARCEREALARSRAQRSGRRPSAPIDDRRAIPI